MKTGFEKVSYYEILVTVLVKVAPGSTMGILRVCIQPCIAHTLEVASSQIFIQEARVSCGIGDIYVLKAVSVVISPGAVDRLGDHRRKLAGSNKLKIAATVVFIQVVGDIFGFVAYVQVFPAVIVIIHPGRRPAVGLHGC